MATTAAGNGTTGISVSTAFGSGFNLLSRHMTEIVVAALLLGSVPWIVLDVFSKHIMTRLDLNIWQRAGANLVVGVAVEVVGMTAAFGLIARIATAAADNRDEPVARSLDIALRRYPALLVMALIRDIATWVGLILLIVPGLILSVMWSVATPAMVAEGLGPVAGLVRSADLTRGVRWRIFGFLLVIGIAEALGNFLLGLAAGSFYGGKAGLIQAIGFAWPIWYMCAMAIYHGVVIAVSGSIFAALYLQLRERKDGPQTDTLAEVFA